LNLGSINYKIGIVKRECKMENVNIAELIELSESNVFNITKYEIHVYYFSIQPRLEEYDKFYRFLSEDEKEKSRKYRFIKDAQKYVVRRGIIRLLLSKYTGIAPKNLEYEYSKKGKPTLKTSRNSNKIFFNLSYSGEALLVTIASEREVGIDVEQIKELPEEGLLAKKFFSAFEYKRYLHMKEQKDLKAFYKCWTCKEAYVKATGMGLTGDYVEEDIQFCEEVETVSPVKAGKRWMLKNLSISHDNAVALCVEGRSWNTIIRCFHIDEANMKKF